MKLELKFRAWDKRFNKMDFGRGDLLLRVNDDYSDVMQFTGLQDKNGVDIYEGDIDSEGCIFEYDVQMGGWFRMKNFEGTQWHAQSVIKGRLPFLIVGNIYKNPI